MDNKMNNLDIIKIGLRNLQEVGEKHHNDIYDVIIIKDFFEIVKGLDEMIVRHYLFFEALHEFRKGLPKYKHINIAMVKKTFLERITELIAISIFTWRGVSIKESSIYVEDMKLVYRNRNRQSLRNEVTFAIIEIERMASLALKKIAKDDNHNRATMKENLR